MNHCFYFTSAFTVVAAQGGSPSGYGITKYARNAASGSTANGRTQVLDPSTGKPVANTIAVSQELNNHLARDYLIALAGFTFVFLLYRLVLCAIHYTRTLACLNNNTQRYFATPNVDWNNLKLHMLYAPLFKARHKQEVRLSSALSMGTLPTRFQSIVLAAIMATNVILCVYDLPWHESAAEVLPILRNRTGSIAMANLIPVMVLSSPKNPLIKLLNIPFDSMNIIHRNLARLAIFEAVIHTLCYIIGTVKTSKLSLTELLSNANTDQVAGLRRDNRSFIPI